MVDIGTFTDPAESGQNPHMAPLPLLNGCTMLDARYQGSAGLQPLVPARIISNTQIRKGDYYHAIEGNVLCLS